MHIRSESDKAQLRWSLDRMRQELREQQPGGSLVAQQLATTMLVLALRLHLTPAELPGQSPFEEPQQPGSTDTAGVSGRRAGWLVALADRQMKAAITAMHEQPAHGWTLQGLAERSGMSRSVFALKFKATVGVSPMEYLTRWRMLLAGNRLTDTDDSIAGIARSLGYASESAFSKAFRRGMGCSPRQHRRGQGSDAARGNEGRRSGTPPPGLPGARFAANGQVLLPRAGL